MIKTQTCLGFKGTAACVLSISLLSLAQLTLADAHPAEWIGNGANALASTPANWKDGVCPVEGQDVLVTGDRPMTWDLNTEVGSWTQRDYSGTVTIGTVQSGDSSASPKVLVVRGDVALSSGTWTHTGIAKNGNYCLNVLVRGDMTIAEGAAVTVKGRGYEKYYFAGGKQDGSLYLSSHGGQGRAWEGSVTDLVPFGSIVNPVTAASGSEAASGGGIIKLEVNGNLVVDGEISADGDDNTYYPAGGGSINIVASTLSGAGTIHADGPNSTYGTGTRYKSGGGGGRIAVTLTGTGADFSGFPVARFSAVGGGNNNGYGGGAGTLYLRTANQDVEHGHLIVRNRSMSNPAETTIGGEVEGESFGTVTIEGSSELHLVDGARMVVHGDWNNKAKFISGRGSKVRFADSNSISVCGNNTFAQLECVEQGKTIVFEAGSVQTIAEGLSLRGGLEPGRHVSLVGADGGGWSLCCAGAACALSGVALSNCTCDVAITVVNGKDLGGNSDNITFVTIAPGEEIVWTGANGTQWEEGANWNRNRTPIETDFVRVPAVANSPVLASDVSIAKLTVEAGAALRIGRQSLSVSGNASFNGILTGDVNAQVHLGGDVAAGGVWNIAGAAIYLVGESGRVVEFTTASKLPKLFVSGEILFDGDFVCEGFVAFEGASLTFKPGSTVVTDSLRVNGTSNLPVTLTASDVWQLVAQESAVEYANVRNCDASAGPAIVSSTSVDGGNNVNWYFEDTRVAWIGGDSGDFCEASNWSSKSIPGEGDDVIISGPVNVRLSENDEARVNSLSVGTGARFVIDGSLSTLGSVTIARSAAVEWNKHGEIGGSFSMLDYAVLTHRVGGGDRIDINVAGAGLVQARAKIDAKGCGYTYGTNPYERVPFNAAGSHGGRGYAGNTAAMAAYGSIVSPVTCGGAGGNVSFATHPGGGAVSISFGGVLTLDGEIDADAADHDTIYGGAGGSVRLVAKTLSGSGIIHANGDKQAAFTQCGAGGRVSVVLTAGDFSDWRGVIEAYGGEFDHKTYGSAGTVYLEAAGKPGVLRICNRANTQRDDVLDMTDFPSAGNTSEVTGVDVIVGDYGTLYLTQDMVVHSLAIEGKSPRILLNGHTLEVTTITSRKQRQAIESIVIPGGTAEAPGKIAWKKPGILLMVR